jgi:head-tail adaptor
MDCQLVYALVPNRPLQESLEARAEQVARDHVLRVRHSMALEDQQIGSRVVDQFVLTERRGYEMLR